jgi:hypothetical protein
MDQELDLQCAKCDYPLASFSIENHCPECGYPQWATAWNLSWYQQDFDLYLSTLADAQAVVLREINSVTGHSHLAVGLLQVCLEHVAPRQDSVEPIRHVTAAQVVEGLYAMFYEIGYRRGYEACRSLNLHTASKIGDLVVAMVDRGLVRPAESDHRSDFDSLLPAKEWFKRKRRCEIIVDLHRRVGGEILAICYRVGWRIRDIGEPRAFRRRMRDAGVG